MKRSTLEKLQDFHRAGNAGIHQELALFLREKIASGELLAGEQLPSLRELSRLWKTNQFSIRLATDELVGRGLLNKQQGRGMFIAPSIEMIRRVGIFASQHFGPPRNLLAFAYLREALTARLRELNFEYLYLDDADALRSAVLANRIQAVIGLIVSDHDKIWFDRLPLRKAVIMRDTMLDFTSIATYLNEYNRRRIAAIVPAATPGGAIKVSFLITGLKAAGVKIMERNLRVISQETLACRNWDEIGYEKTLELLRAPLRPDALIVYPDNAVTGAIQAILQLGICVPEERELLKQAVGISFAIRTEQTRKTLSSPSLVWVIVDGKKYRFSYRPSTGEWVENKILFPKGRVEGFEIGMNPKKEKITYWIRNVRLLYSSR